MTKAAEFIAGKLDGCKPSVAIILGSGLGNFAQSVENALVLDYADLEGFPKPGVAGHGGKLFIGTIGKTEVAVLQGRAHYYEHGNSAVMRPAIETLKAIGCTTLVLTNAAGSTREGVTPGNIVLIKDHISLSAPSPLIGVEDNSRFTDLTDAWSSGLRKKVQAKAADLDIDLPEGVYMLFPGPNFETPAEIRAAQVLGADLVGMSTVPECILARWMGLNVMAISNVTNMAAGMEGVALSHSHTLEQSRAGAAKLQTLLTALCEDRIFDGETE